MSTFLFIITIIYVLFRITGEKQNDADVRKHAIDNGLPFYASSTGLRDTKTNKKYYK